MIALLDTCTAIKNYWIIENKNGTLSRRSTHVAAMMQQYGIWFCASSVAFDVLHCRINFTSSLLEQLRTADTALAQVAAPKPKVAWNQIQLPYFASALYF